MRTGGRCAALFLFLVVLAVPAPAAAGGWWSFIELESTYLAPGMRVEAADSGLSFTSTKEAERARRTGRYYVYLIEGLDLDTVKDQMLRADPRRGWWALGDAMALRAGRVSLGGWNANLAKAHARFVTPDLRPGIYTVMFCDAGCRHPLGDAIPSNVRVVADPLTARIAGRLERQKNRTAVEHQRLVTRQRLLSEWSHAAIVRLRREIGGLEERLDQARRASRGDEASGTGWWIQAGWYVAGVATAALLIVVTRRRPRHPAPPDEWTDPSVGEELLVGPRAR